MKLSPLPIAAVAACFALLGLVPSEARAQRRGGGAVGGGMVRGGAVVGGGGVVRSAGIYHPGTVYGNYYGNRYGYGYGNPGYYRYSPGYYRYYPGYYGFGIGLGFGYPYYYGGYSYAWPYYDPYDRVAVGSFFGGYAYDYVPPTTVSPPGGAIGGYMPSYQPGAGNPQIRSASVQVAVPAPDAELWFNGAKTQTLGLKREFTTPDLPAGQTFTYEVRARWMQEGKQFDQTRTLTVSAGSQSGVVFSASDREILPQPVPKQ
jgi:uncharacterized protein (TIGR03000 family)